MHKAKEWVAAYKTKDEFITAYVAEIAKLVSDRTAKSLPETKYFAAEGAIREQKSKYVAICSKIVELNEASYDVMVELAVPELKQWKALTIKEVKQTKEDDVAAYRKSKRR